VKTLTVRRWCETCGRFTRSRIDPPDEVCAEHQEPDEDEMDFWTEDDDADEW
jgi:hypothetical protein